MSVAILSLEEKKLIEAQMDANLKANMETLVKENARLRSDLKIMSMVDPEVYRSALDRIKDLESRLSAIKHALQGFDQ